MKKFNCVIHGDDFLTFGKEGKDMLLIGINSKKNKLGVVLTKKEALRLSKEILKEFEKTFKCDFCGENKPLNEKFKVYDENFKLQRGLHQCAKCEGL